MEHAYQHQPNHLQDLSKKKIIKTIAPLSAGYLPEELRFRDEVLKRLIFSYKHILQCNTFTHNTVILGPASAGKSTVVKWFMKHFRLVALPEIPRFYTFYLNCVEYPTLSKVFRKIYTEICKTESGRGWDDFVIIKEILTRLKRNNAYMLITLDEVHHLKNKDLLRILQMAETFGEQNSPFSFILLTRQYDWINSEDAKVLDRVNDKIVLLPYTKEQMYTLLEKRAEKALIDGSYSRELLTHIVERAPENLRLCIDILRNCAIRSEQNERSNIPSTYITDAKFYSPYRHILDTLNFNQQLGFLAILKNDWKPSTVHIYELYESLCKRYNQKPYVPMSFRKVLRDLQANHLIMSELKTVGAGRGKYNVHYLQDGLDKETLIRDLEDIAAAKAEGREFQ